MNRKKIRIVELIFVSLLIAIISSLTIAIPGTATFSNDIVGRWHFDEGIGSDAYDSSGYDNHGILSGGKFGNALRFDGIDDYVEVPDDDSLDISGDITLEAWIYINAFSTSEGYHMYIVSKDSAGQRSYGIGVDLNYYGGGNKPFVIIFHSLGNYKIAWGDNVLDTEIWYHIAGVYDISEDELRLYVNNVPQTMEYTSTSINTGSANLRIGARDYIGHQCFFNGLIDEVRISNSARTSFDLFNAPDKELDTVALWHFDESIGSIAQDETDNNNDGTIYGSLWAGPTWTDGLFGKALYFDDSDYVSIDDSPSLDAIADLSIELWLNPSITYTSGAADFYVFLSKFGPNSFQFVYHPAGYLYLWVDGGMAIRSKTFTLNIGTWYYLAATFESGTGKSHIYVNDEDITADTASLVMNTNDCPLLIGARPCPSPTYPKHFVQGTIDELRIWNRVLSVEEITSHSWGLVGEWDFDEGSDGTAYDSSGFGNHGTLNGDPMWVLGKYGTALELDGNDYIRVPNDPSLNIGQGTWEAWLKFNAKPSEVTMMNPIAKANQYWIHASNGADDPYDGESITLVDSIQVKVTVGGIRYIASTPAYFIETGFWYHVAGTYDGETLKLYVNGELIDMNTDPSGAIDSQDPDLTIGTWSTLIDSFIGVIDDVRIWNHALTADEIKGYIFGLMGEWKFDEGIGSIAYDTSGFENNGTLSGGKFGNGLSFDGIDDHILIPHSDSLNIGGTGITLEAWIKAKSFPSTGRVISIAKRHAYALQISEGGKVRVWLGPITPFTTTDTPVLSIDTWHHIATTYDGINVKIYVDGILKKEVEEIGVQAQSDSDLYIGNNEDFTGPFNGIIDEVHISSIARTSFDLTKAPFEDENTVALWHFDESMGSIAYDETDNNNDGTIFEAEWAGPTWMVGGKYGEALYFDGIDDYIEIPHTESLDITNQLTVEAWIKLNSVDMSALGGTIIRKGAWPIVDPPPTWGFDIKYGKLRAFIYDEGTAYIADGSTILSAGSWHHVAFTYDGLEVKIYLNGILDGTPTSHIGDIDSSDSPIWIGRKDEVDFFEGSMDEVRIWNKALVPIKFIQTGLDISALGELVVTVDDPISLNYEALPYVMMVRNTAVVTYEFEDFVASSDLGKQFRLVDPVGQNSITITEPTTLTGTYVTQYEITFDQVGLDGTANGELVVTFDSTTKNTENLPYTTWFDAGDEISYTYSNPVLSSVIDKQFWLTSVDGPGSPFIVTEPLTIIGNYLALPLSKITTSDLCYFDINDDLEGQQFRLIFTQNPLDPSHSTYKLTASNPGQFYYNVFFAGTPGSEAPLTINIPYPFETQGANPIHIYSYVSIGPEGCFIPSNEISCNFVIEILSDNGLEISIDGNVPESGLIYVTIHLDYGLKKEVGFIKDAYDNAINQGIDTENDFDDLYIYNYENYQFSYSFYNMPIDDEVIQNINVFKHDPGFAGLVLDGSNTPIANVKVEIYDPDNNLLTTLFTDDDGFYFFHYKHTGKGAMYVVKLPDYNVEQEVYVKANKFVEVNFQI